MDELEVTLEFWRDRRAQARQSEDQRATLSNLVLLVEVAGLGVIASQGLTRTMFAVSIPLIFLGAYGVVGTLKLYERHQLHASEARQIAKRIDQLMPSLEVKDALKDAARRHERRHPVLRRVRLHHIWTVLHVGGAMLGALLTVAILK
jgi:hypothetical protein